MTAVLLLGGIPLLSVLAVCLVVGWLERPHDTTAHHLDQEHHP